MKTIIELDAVVLTCDLPEFGLKTGDVGTAVLVHGEGAAFEVEFVGYDGHTVALMALGVRDQVVAQFGPSSNEVQSIGRKKKSERKAPTRKSASS